MCIFLARRRPNETTTTKKELCFVSQCIHESTVGMCVCLWECAIETNSTDPEQLKTGRRSRTQPLRNTEALSGNEERESAHDNRILDSCQIKTHRVLRATSLFYTYTYIYRHTYTKHKNARARAHTHAYIHVYKHLRHARKLMHVLYSFVLALMDALFFSFLSLFHPGVSIFLDNSVSVSVLACVAGWAREQTTNERMRTGMFVLCWY